MRIEFLTVDGRLAEDLGAYAEYRLFSAISEHVSRIESVRVSVGTRPMATADAHATCVIVAQLLSGHAVRTKSAASHAAAAIDRAIARVSGAIAMRLADEDGACSQHRAANCVGQTRSNRKRGQHDPTQNDDSA